MVPRFHAEMCFLFTWPPPNFMAVAHKIQLSTNLVCYKNNTIQYKF